MSDIQKSGAATPAASEIDPTLTPRRILAFIISIVLGTGVVAVAIITILKTGLGATIPLSGLFPEVPLLAIAAIPAAFFFLIWVDYFMGTKIIPD